MRDLEAKTPPSVSLIANIRDVDNAIPINDCVKPVGGSHATPPAFRRHMDSSSNLGVSGQVGAFGRYGGNSPALSYGNNCSGGGTIKNDVCTNTRSEMLSILNELRFITKKIKEDIEGNEETNDWKFAAMVVDRLCFWIFTFYLVAATVVIFTSPFFRSESET